MAFLNDMLPDHAMAVDMGVLDVRALLSQSGLVSFASKTFEMPG